MTSRRPLLLGHRGARREAPENTLAAFDLALAHGCDGFEFDVRSTSDHRMILCHDPELARLEVANSTYRSILQRWKPQSAGVAKKDCEVIPCLEDVMARYPSGAFIDIELKVRGIESAAIKAARKCNRQMLIFSSFLPEVLQELRRLAPRIQLGWICDQRSSLPFWTQLPCDVLVANHKLLDEELVQRVHAAMRKIFVWTVNDKQDMLRFAQLGVDAIISDDTRMLGKAFTSVHTSAEHRRHLRI